MQDTDPEKEDTGYVRTGMYNPYAIIAGKFPVAYCPDYPAEKLRVDRIEDSYPQIERRHK